MQLRLTQDEVRLLYEVLRAGAGDLCERVSQVDNAEISALGGAQVARNIDFDSDELDRISDLIHATDSLIKQKIASEESGDMQHALQLKQVVLRSLIDKVSEACAML